MSTADTSAYQYESADFQAATLTTASISLVTASIVVLCYVTYPTIRTRSVRLLLALAIGDILTAVGHLLPNANPQLCRLQGFLLQFGDLSTVTWLLCISHQRITQFEEHVVPWKFAPLYSIASWGIAFISAFVVLVDGAYGPTDIGCWIPNNYVAYRLITFNIPIFVMLMMFAYNSIYARRLLHRRTKAFAPGCSAEYEHAGRIILIHALLLCAIHVPALLHRIAETTSVATTTPTDTVSAIQLLALLHTIFSPLQGVVNILLFLANKHVHRAIHLIRVGGVLPLVGKVVYIMTDECGQVISDTCKQSSSRTATQVCNIIDLPFPKPKPPPKPKQAKVLHQLTNDTVGGLAGESLYYHTVFVGTWNVGNNVPPADLSCWLSRARDYDIVAIGCQESAYKVPHTSIIMYNLSPGGGALTADTWFRLITDNLGPGYTAVTRESLWHIRLIVFVKSHLLPQLHSVDQGFEATGVANMLGNKGSVYISLNLGALSYAFITAHLAAHSGATTERNDDVKQIVSSMSPCNRDLSTYHAVFFFGDLNYRYNSLVTTKDVMRLLDATGSKSTNRFDRLQQYDELKGLLRSNGILYQFVEEDALYPPTYKYLSDRKLADVRKKHASLRHDVADNAAEATASSAHDVQLAVSAFYNAKRAPAWTDRVLWFCRTGLHIESVDNDSVTAISTSDHKPIFTCFRISYSTDLDDIRQWSMEQASSSDDSKSRILYDQSRSRRGTPELLKVYRSLPVADSPRNAKSTVESPSVVSLQFLQLQVFDIFTPSTLPVLEPFIEMRLQFAANSIRPTLPSCTNPVSPLYRAFSTQELEPSVRIPTSTSENPSTPLVSPNRRSKDETADDNELVSTLSEFLHSSRNDGNANEYLSFLVAEWQETDIPVLSLSSGTAAQIANEWMWHGEVSADKDDSEALLRVLACGQVAIKLRDRSMAGDEDLMACGVLECREIVGATIQRQQDVAFRISLLRETRYSGFVTGIVRLSLGT